MRIFHYTYQESGDSYPVIVRWMSESFGANSHTFDQKMACCETNDRWHEDDLRASVCEDVEKEKGVKCEDK